MRRSRPSVRHTCSRAPVPKRFGGLGLDFDVILTVAAELGRGCGSTAWVYGVWAADSWLVGMYPERAQEEYWATGPNTLCASALNPGGATSLTAVDGGYRLSGQWDFASGCDAATWMLVLGAGAPGVLGFLVPRSDFAIRDTWFASGLRGTGSKDITIEDAFIPSIGRCPWRTCKKPERQDEYCTILRTIGSLSSPLPATLWRRP